MNSVEVAVNLVSWGY